MEVNPFSTYLGSWLLTLSVEPWTKGSYFSKYLQVSALVKPKDHYPHNHQHGNDDHDLRGRTQRGALHWFVLGPKGQHDSSAQNNGHQGSKLNQPTAGPKPRPALVSQRPLTNESLSQTFPKGWTGLFRWCYHCVELTHNLSQFF
jgi:hypothetical protein